MVYKNKKITLRQAMLLFITIICSPSIRIVPRETAELAKQAAWLSPLPSLITIFLYFLVLQGIFKNHQDESFVEILQDVLGRVTGKILGMLYFIWITFLASYYVRIYAERILGSMFPDMSLVFCILIMLILAAYILRNGLETLARMNEVFLPIILIIFYVSNILLLNKLKIKYLYPITYEDIIPVLKASAFITSLWPYILIIFIFSDKINNKEKIVKVGMETALITTFSISSAIAVSLGIFGWSIVTKMPIPYLDSVRQISLLDFIERLDAGVFTIWILSDFILITTFSFAAVYILKILFKTSDTKPLFSIYSVILLFLSLLIGKSFFELSALAMEVLYPINIFMGLIIPLIAYVIGKIRNKL